MTNIEALRKRLATTAAKEPRERELVEIAFDAISAAESLSGQVADLMKGKQETRQHHNQKCGCDEVW